MVVFLLLSFTVVSNLAISIGTNFSTWKYSIAIANDLKHEAPALGLDCG